MTKNPATTIDVSQLRQALRDVLDHVIEEGKRLVIVRHDRPIAAIVPLGDLQNLEEGTQAAIHRLRAQAAMAPSSQRTMTIQEALDQLPDDFQEEGVRPLKASLAAASKSATQRTKQGRALQEVKDELVSLDERASPQAIHALRVAMTKITDVLFEEVRREQLRAWLTEPSDLLVAGSSEFYLSPQAAKKIAKDKKQQGRGAA